MGTRRKGRERALQLLFQVDFSDKALEAEKRAGFWADRNVLPEVKNFSELLVSGVIRHREEIDGLLKKYATNWSPERLAIVDRNILRFSIFEILYLDEIPPSVTINEAIEIAKKFGNENSGGFVNGILDKIQCDSFNRVLSEEKLNVS